VLERRGSDTELVSDGDPVLRQEQADQRVVVHRVGEQEVQLAAHRGAAPLILFGADAAFEPDPRRLVQPGRIEGQKAADQLADPLARGLGARLDGQLA